MNDQGKVSADVHAVQPPVSLFCLQKILIKHSIIAGHIQPAVNKLPAGVMHFHIPVLFNQSKALKYVTGMPVTFGTFFEAGKRGYTLERHVNTRFGIDRKDDSLPGRLTDEPQIPGDEKTKVPLEKMKNVYYKARGWSKDGIPTKKTLIKLKIELKKK